MEVAVDPSMNIVTSAPTAKEPEVDPKRAEEMRDILNAFSEPSATDPGKSTQAVEVEVPAKSTLNNVGPFMDKYFPEEKVVSAMGKLKLSDSNYKHQ